VYIENELISHDFFVRSLASAVEAVVGVVTGSSLLFLMHIEAI